jgi:hypothetical protein
MFECKKTQILIAHQKEKNRPDKTSTPSSQKKYCWRLEDFAPIFGKYTAPYGMFEWKKTQILIAHQKEKNRPDKTSTPSSQKKYSRRLEDFAPIFGKYTTPYGMFEWKKTQILIAHQKEKNRPDKTSAPSSQKKYSWRLKNFDPIFGK